MKKYLYIFCTLTGAALMGCMGLGGFTCHKYVFPMV